MKKKVVLCLSLILVTLYWSCGDDFNVEIPDLDYPESIIFNRDLSSYNIYEGNLANLNPSSDFHLLELSSTLFTDYSQKQRLIRLPSGTQLESLDAISFDFPDETILVKTFYYYNDLRDTTLGKRVIETRLMIKSEGIWNSATYIWNDDQNEAILTTLGSDTNVSWIDNEGNNVATFYHIPNHNECFACHQSNMNMIPLGTTQVNLNRTVSRNGTLRNQLEHLQIVNVLSANIDPANVATMADYKDTNNPVSERARAYLNMNCAHCHNPNGWEEAAVFDLDFRYETEINATGIEAEANRIARITRNGRMPYIGTTLLDEEGIAIISEYIENL